MAGRKSHGDYARTTTEPLEVEALVHCGQFRDLDSRRNVNTLTKMYRVEPVIEGKYIFVTLDQATGKWVVRSTLGEDIEGSPLVCIGEIQEVVSTANTWTKMETALATYFGCSIYEFHAKSKDQRRLKARPLDND